MNGELKEILELFGSTDENIMFGDIVELNSKQSHQLLKYITNLQRENERLKENAIHNDKIVDNARWNEMIYKSRNEKAIEYIKEWQSFPHTNGSTHNELRNLLNILNSGDEE